MSKTELCGVQVAGGEEPPGETGAGAHGGEQTAGARRDGGQVAPARQYIGRTKMLILLVTFLIFRKEAKFPLAFYTFIMHIKTFNIFLEFVIDNKYYIYIFIVFL